MIKCRLKKRMQTSHGPQTLDLDMDLPGADFIGIFGKSGAGKTTFLRMLAGLTQPDEGTIEVDGEVWFDSARRISRPIRQRRVGFVFQDNSLFPNMTVAQNVAFAGPEKEWISLLGLEGLQNQRPHQLSGGQKQRAALARALAGRPRILVLDEPLSDLDAAARMELQEVIAKVYEETKVTTLLVSHDVAEIFKLAQKIFVIHKGRVVQSGSPAEVLGGQQLSGKFKFTAEVLFIQRDGVINILTLAIGRNLTKVIATDEEIQGLAAGSKVIVASKAFNPVIIKGNSGIW